MKTLGILLCLLTLCGAVGCMYNPSDAIKGGTTTVSVNLDPETGKPLGGSFSHNGDLANVKGLTLHFDKDTYARMGSMSTDDTALTNAQGQGFVAQQQAYLQGAQTAMQLIGAIASHGFTPAAGSGTLPTFQPGWRK